MKEHLVVPSKDQNLISSFLLTLKRDMKLLSQDSTVYEITLESMLFTRVILISTYHEVWATYVQDKVEGMFVKINYDCKVECKVGKEQIRESQEL
jgi:hypothetical protein